MMIPLVSFFPRPPPPPRMFSLLNYSIILKVLHYFGKLLLFVIKLQPISHFKFEFFLPSSDLLVLPFYPPPKNIKVDPIIRIILVPPLSSVNLSRDVVRENRGGGGGAWAAPKWNDTFYRGLWKLMESLQFESRPAPAPSPLGAPSFWKDWLRPS